MPGAAASSSGAERLITFSPRGLRQVSFLAAAVAIRFQSLPSFAGKGMYIAQQYTRLSISCMSNQFQVSAEDGLQLFSSFQ